MKIKRVDLGPQERPLKRQIMKSISSIIDSKEFILGKNVNSLEEKIAKYIGVADAIGVASGTDAMTLSLTVLGIGKGDEVITTPFTMAANVEAILHVGAKPVFADVDRETFNILPSEIERKITPATKAILPVHIFGNPCDMEKIMEIAARHKLHVIEDACQAFGSEIGEKKCGSFGILSALSFFPTKNLGGYGDGGMILINDTAYSEKLRQLRAHGQEKKYIYKYLGWNSRLDELQAAVILPKMRKIDGWNLQRRKLALKYHKLLSNIPQVNVPLVAPGHVFHLYTIKAGKRDLLQKFLGQGGIQTTVNFPLPLHLQQAYNDGSYHKGDYPNAEYLCERGLSLPLFVGMSDAQVKYVCGKVREFYSKN